jgi:predicted 3-demethylubiquinone-9 3-methyltransferase (glyoxalase superfamily)
MTQVLIVFHFKSNLWFFFNNNNTFPAPNYLDLEEDARPKSITKITTTTTTTTTIIITTIIIIDFTLQINSIFFCNNNIYFKFNNINNNIKLI